jgi:hypothetical protein
MLNENRVRELDVDATGKGGVAMQSPQRERGLWSFLTWSFFLAQLAAGSAFASGAAQAGATTDLNAPDGSSNSGAVGTQLLATPDLRALDISEPDATGAPSAATAVPGNGVLNETNAGGAEAPVELAGDNTPAQQFADLVGSAAAESPPAANDDGSVLPGDGPGIEIALPDLGGVLRPVLETVGDLVEGLGPTLDGLLVPVVATVEDLADVLGSTIDLALSPATTLVEGLTGGLEPVLDPLFAPVEALTEGIGGLLEPVGAIGGELMQLADTAIDIVEPILTPVMKIVDAAEPILDPVLEVASPIVDLVEPVVSPLLNPLAPIAQPVLDLLPAGLGESDGLLGGLFAGHEPADAVSSPGSLQFVAAAEANGFELMETGAYTEFGISLQEGVLNPESGGADLTEHIALDISVLTGDGDDTGLPLPTLIGHLQQEIALRGLGEGLI